MFDNQYLSLPLNPALIRMLLGDAFRNDSTMGQFQVLRYCAQ